MKTIFTSFLLISFTSSLSFGTSLLGDLFGQKTQAGSCSNKLKPDDIMYKSTYEQNLFRALGLKGEKKYCESIIYFDYLTRQDINADQLLNLKLNLIESFFYQYDYNQFFDHSYQFIKDYPGASKEEYVRYLLLKAVNELSLRFQTTDSSNPWVQYGLGAHPEQFNEDSEKNLLKYRLFLEKYPNSFWYDDVRSYYDSAKQSFNTSYANDLRFLVLRREYAPAISRYKFLISQGVEMPDFTLYVYECVQVMIEFSVEISNPLHVPDSALAKWLSTPIENMNNSVRDQTQTALVLQAQVLLRTLVNKFPKDSWSILAKENFKNLL